MDRASQARASVISPGVLNSYRALADHEAIAMYPVRVWRALAEGALQVLYHSYHLGGSPEVLA